ncbi:MAG: hypothetical protein HY270_17640 [Deltaproteobacteria bacterium]|nr:hypothetical protein [Deltaproteobacteria bacterium]
MAQTAYAESNIAPEVILPSQYYTENATASRSPERRLMLAILEDAVLTILKYAGKQSKRARRLVRDVERWVALKDRSWIFSFESICSVLDIDANAMRNSLRSSQLRAEKHGTARVVVFHAGHRTRGRQRRLTVPRPRQRLVVAK